MNTDFTAIEIRTFANAEEIFALPKFTQANPIDKNNYHRLIGDYWLPDELHCCFKKENGNLCNEGHKWGFVAELKDGSVTIVGNNCANTKFGADSKIKADRSKYLNEKRRRERLASLSDLLVTSQSNIEALRAARIGLKNVELSITSLGKKLGTEAHRNLENRARTGNTAVDVIGVNYHEYIDEDDKPQRERRATSRRIGNISGLSSFNQHLYQAIYSEISSIEKAYQKAVLIDDNIKLSDLEALTSTLSNFDNVIGKVQEQTEQERIFLAGDLPLLCFLIADKSERYKIARIILEIQGNLISRDKSKD